MRWVLKLLCFVALPTGLHAGSFEDPWSEMAWELVPGLSSASLPAEGWRNTSSSGLYWPDGRHAVISYWQLETGDGIFTLRCISSFDVNLQPTGDECFQPKEAL